MITFLTPDGQLVPGAKAPLEDARVIEFYRQMSRARRLDAQMLRLQRMGRLGTFAPCFGQEAAQVGSIAALGKKDWFVPAFRETAAALFRGASMKSIVLYVMGLEEGSMLLSDARDLPISVPVSSQNAHAVGLAWAMKLQKSRDIAIVYFGDGATSEGVFHESMNFAGVYKLGVVFFCQNNQWAISTPRKLQTASPSIAQKAEAHGFPGIQVDGNDLFAVYSATMDAVRRAREGQPTLIEAVTYRRGVHTTADDPRVYRTEEEEKAWVDKDPIERIARYLRGRKLWDDAKQKALDEEIDKEISTAVAEAEKYREERVDPLEMFDFVYKRMPADLKAQREEARALFGGRRVTAGPGQGYRGPGGAAAVGELEEAPPESKEAPNG